MASRPPRILPQSIASYRPARNPVDAQRLSLVAGTTDWSPRRQPRIKTIETDTYERRAKRRPTALPGLITFRNLRLQLPCTISDVSGSGARLDLSPTAFHTVRDVETFPHGMGLVFRADRVTVPCEVRWRRDSSLGVRFLGPPVPLPKSEA